MSASLSVHNVTRIQVDRVLPKCIELVVTDKTGARHEITFYSERPLEIEGASFCNFQLMEEHAT